MKSSARYFSISSPFEWTSSSDRNTGINWSPPLPICDRISSKRKEWPKCSNVSCQDFACRSTESTKVPSTSKITAFMNRVSSSGFMRFRCSTLCYISRAQSGRCRRWYSISPASGLAAILRLRGFQKPLDYEPVPALIPMNQISKHGIVS